MLIDNTYKYVFIHIPKTGGTAVTKSILTNIPSSFSVKPTHQSLKELKKEFKSFYTFAFVRNPWARAYSSFCQAKRRGYEEVNNKDFNEFVMTYKNPENYSQKRYILKNDKVDIDFIGTLENIEIDFEKVCIKLFKRRLNLEIHNKSDQGNQYKEFFTKESQELVEKYCQWEIEKFGYTFK